MFILRSDDVTGRRVVLSGHFMSLTLLADNVEVHGPCLLKFDWKTADFTLFRLRSSQDVYEFYPLKALEQFSIMHPQESQTSGRTQFQEQGY